MVPWGQEVEEPLLSDHLIAPHGGELVDLSTSAARAAELREASRDWPSWDLTPRQLVELELLAGGAYSPLCGYLSESDYLAVRDRMRLVDGTLWPLPTSLDVTEEMAEVLEPGMRLALRDSEGVMLGCLDIADIYQPDLLAEADLLARLPGDGTSGRPPAARRRPVYLGGAIESVQPPVHYDFGDLRHTPAELRRELAKLGWRRVVAYPTHSPMHRVHFEQTLRAVKELEAGLLIHSLVGPEEDSYIDHFTRVRCHRAIVKRYPPGTATLSVLPVAATSGGPRELLLSALVHRNFGVTDVMVGQEVGNPAVANESIEAVGSYMDEAGVALVSSETLVYLPDDDRFVAGEQAPLRARVLEIDEVELRQRLVEGRRLPAWFTFPEVADILEPAFPPRSRQGFTVFFTGLSGSGKSTIANALKVRLLEMGGRSVTLLDGDLVRKHLSSELGFSREHRDLNIRRIGFVASEITKNGGVAICAPIAPYDATRKDVRSMISRAGGFVLVHVATPLDICEQRDRKGLYAKAREGVIKEFTGISDPYEEPADAEMVMDTSETTPEEAAQEVILHLEREGYLG
ncbi:MAG: putative bifunctional SAT/APS kinase [Acidimicrobiales bacterium]|nr:putative bifunctional SAT/APS kinase [Acidimicrobiales bacterium]